jgi:hypothetical protein
VFFNWPFSKTYRVKCPDGSVKSVYRHVDDAFPLYIQGWQGDFNAEIKAMEAGGGRTKPTYRLAYKKGINEAPLLP